MSKMLEEINEQPQVAARVIDESRRQCSLLRERLLKKGKIFLVGTGASLNACGAALYAFYKYLGKAPVVIPASQLTYAANALSKDDIVILVSQSGQSYETQEAVGMLSAWGVELWGITNSPDSVLAKGAQETLYMNAGEEVSSATKTYTASLVLLYLLAMGEMQEAAFAEIPGAIASSIASLSDPISTMSRGYNQESIFYILGAGANGVTAGQASLMIKEKAFLNVEGMALSEFRHGPVEVVKEGLPIFITASTPEMAVNAVSHGKSLVSMGALVTLVSDSAVDAPIPVLRFTGVGYEEISHPMASVPYQLLAEALAVRFGYEVDSFKHINKIVDKY